MPNEILTTNTIPGMVVENTFQNGRKEGMLDGWRKDHPIQEYIERAGKVIGHEVATDWRKQAALVVFGVGVYFALRQALKDRVPEVVVGHSIGEASSLVQRGMVGFEEMVEVMNQREEICASTRPQEVLEQRGMAALLKVPALEVISRLSGVDPNEAMVWIANFNAEAQTVLSGVRENIEYIYGTYLRDGILRPLPLPGAYHSGDMKAEHAIFSPLVRRNLRIVGQPDGKISSPMLKAVKGRSWIQTGEEGILVAANQLITSVFHLQSWKEDIVPEIHPKFTVAIDPSGSLAGVIKPNVGSDVPIITISDQESFDKGIERIRQLVS